MVHKKANKIRDAIGFAGWTDDAEDSIEEKAYTHNHPGED